MALIQLSKGGYKRAQESFAKIRAEAVANAEKAGKEVINLQIQQKGAKKGSEEWLKIQEKIDQLNTSQDKNYEISHRLQGAANGKLVSMGQNLGSLTDDAPEYFLKMISGIMGVKDVTTLGDKELQAAMVGVEGATNGKINMKLVQKLISITTNTNSQLKRDLGLVASYTETGDVTMVGVLKKIAKSNTQLSQEEKTKKTDELLTALLGVTPDSKSIEETATSIAKLFNITDKNFGVAMAQGAASNNEFKTGLADIIKQTKEGKIAPEKAQELLSKLLVNSGVATD